MDFKSLMAGGPVPVVGADDVRRVWEFITKTNPRMGAAAGAVGIDIRLIAQQCGEGADPVAVWARVALLQTLLQSGLLDDWRDGDRPYDVIFEAMAAFPLPDGVRRFRPEDFVEALRKPRK